MKYVNKYNENLVIKKQMPNKQNKKKTSKAAATKLASKLTKDGRLKRKPGRPKSSSKL